MDSLDFVAHAGQQEEDNYSPAALAVDILPLVALADAVAAKGMAPSDYRRYGGYPCEAAHEPGGVSSYPSDWTEEERRS